MEFDEKDIDKGIGDVVTALEGLYNKVSELNTSTKIANYNKLLENTLLEPGRFSEQIQENYSRLKEMSSNPNFKGEELLDEVVYNAQLQGLITNILRFKEMIRVYFKDSEDEVAQDFYNESKDCIQLCENVFKDFEKAGVYYHPVLFLETSKDDQNIQWKSVDGFSCFHANDTIGRIIYSKAYNNYSADRIIDISMLGFNCSTLKSSKETSGWTNVVNSSYSVK